MFEQLFTTKIKSLDNVNLKEALKEILFEILVNREKYGETIVKVEDDKIIISDPDSVGRCIFSTKNVIVENNKLNKQLIFNVDDKKENDFDLLLNKFNVLKNLT